VDIPLEEGVPDVPLLTEAQKDVIESTAPVLAEHGLTITEHFCELIPSLTWPS